MSMHLRSITQIISFVFMFAVFINAANAAGPKRTAEDWGESHTKIEIVAEIACRALDPLCGGGPIAPDSCFGNACRTNCICPGAPIPPQRSLKLNCTSETLEAIFTSTNGYCRPINKSTGKLAAAPSNPAEKTCSLVGNPIDTSSGNKYEAETDYIGQGPFPLTFQRYYNSSSFVVGGNLGNQWRHTYERSVVLSPDNTQARVIRPNGRTFYFTPSGSNWIVDTDISDKLVRLMNGSIPNGWEYTSSENDEIETY